MEWVSDAPFSFHLTPNRATFKLTRDSQGASRSTTELQDFRMAFREKRETLFFARSISDLTVSS